MNELDSLSINIALNHSFSYLEYHTDALIKASYKDIYYTPFSLIKKIEITNGTDKEYKDLILHFQFSNPIFSAPDMHTGRIVARLNGEAKKQVIREDLMLKADAPRLYSLNGVDICQIYVEVIDPSDNHKLASVSKRIKILPLNQPTDDYRLSAPLLAKYCVTGFPALEKVHLEAVKELQEIRGKEKGKEEKGSSIIGYQNTLADGKTDKKAILEEIASLYRALHKEGIVYSNPMNSTEKFQNVRLPMQVLKTHQGTCLDLALLFCSALLEVGLRPILVLISGHAFAGCFLEEDVFFPDGKKVETNANVVYTMANGNKKEIVLFECTTAAADSEVSFTEAMKIGEENLRSYRGLFYAADVSLCQKSFFQPIPIKNEEGKIDFNIRPKELEKEAIDEIRDTQFREIEAEEDHDRFSTWEKKLLDLTPMNRLVNFNVRNGDNACVIIGFTADKLYEYLKDCSEQRKQVKIRLLTPDFMKSNGIALNEMSDMTSLVEANKKKNILLGFSNAKNFRKLIKASESAEEETGNPTLYLAFGELGGNDNKGRYEVPLKAPFLLLPLTVRAERISTDYVLDYDFDDVMLNQTFLEYFKVKRGTDYSSVYEVGSQNSFTDIANTIRHMNGGTVQVLDDTAFIANFTFAHYVMWKDIRERKEILAQNEIIRSLLENRSVIQNNSVTTADGEEKSADELDDVSRFAAPLPYDSTQLRAILEAGAGNSFILDGPPGTGKSQTIVNMIVNAIYNGKTVLFVAEKMAALDVVIKRLQKFGLNRFALQLYSNKANKHALFEQLKSTMELGHQKGDDAYDFRKTCREINERKKELNAEIAFLHDRGQGENAKFYSLYEAITKHEMTKAMKGKLTLTAGYAKTYTGNKDEAVRESLDRLIAHAEEIGSLEKSPLAYLALDHFTLTDQENIRPDFKKFKEKIKEAQTDLLALENESELKGESGKSKTLTLFKLIEMTFDCRNDVTLRDLSFAFTNSDAVLSLFTKISDLKVKEDRLLTKLKKESLLTVRPSDIRKALSENKGLFGKVKTKKALAAVLYPSCISDNVPDFETCSRIADELEDYQNGYQVISIDKAKKNLDFYLQQDALKDLAKTLEEKDEYVHERDLYALLMANENPSALSELSSRIFNLMAFKKAAVKKELKKAEESYEAYLTSYQDINSRYPLRDQGLIEKPDALEGMLKITEAVISEEDDYQFSLAAEITKEGKKLSNLGLKELYDGFLSQQYPLDDLEDIYECALDSSFIMLYEAETNGGISDFDSNDYEAVISSYQKLISEYSSIVVAEVIDKVTARFANPKIRYDSSTPIGELNKLCMSGGRGITIRNALKRYEKQIRTYFPCFLMSPLSAAQYLAADAKKFDLVIFDEASQIPTSEAVGPIARGNALIVAGDPQQMPPSDYFSVSASTDDESGDTVKTEDAESLLDDCISIEMPRIRLSFHYRSRHESLIEFSNRSFYGGDLFTFPSYDNRVSHVSFQYVNLKSAKTSNELSNEETKAILNAVKVILENPQNEGKSFGVIVFNLRQQELLQDKITDFFDKNPKLAALAAKSEDKWFVKNLENVQGDERDIIILSIGFAKGKNGKAVINGPLALDKGERRLNVAASRSKEQMIVISTIRYLDIDAEGAKNKGAKNLKDFLYYAEKSSSGSFASNNEGAKDNVTALLKRDIESAGKGYQADLSIGNSEFRISLGIRKEGDKQYKLGLLLDDSPLSKNISCRDRFYVETTMLKGLRWRLMRVYTFQYLKFRKRVLKDIFHNLETIEAEDKDEAPGFIPPRLLSANEEFDYKTVNYVPYKLQKDDYITYDDLKDNEFDSHLAKTLNRILLHESPVSFDHLKEFMRLAFGIQQIKDRGNKILLDHLDRLEGVSKTEDYPFKTFYWSKEMPDHKIILFKKVGLEITDIAKEEIIFLMNRIILAQKDVGKEALIHLTADQLGISTIGPRARKKLEYCLDYGEKNGLFLNGYHPEE